MKLKKKLSPFILLQLFIVLRSKLKLKSAQSQCAFLGMRFIHWGRAL